MAIGLFLEYREWCNEEKEGIKRVIPTPPQYPTPLKPIKDRSTRASTISHYPHYYLTNQEEGI
jgi:hypothetical protein